MIRLIKYELYKIVTRKSVWLFLLIILSFLTFTYYYRNYQPRDERNIQKQVYTGIEGNLNSTKVKKIKLKVQSLLLKKEEDRFFCQDDLNQINTILNWQKNNAKKIHDLSNKISILKQNKDFGFEYKNFVKEKDMLKKVKKPEMHMSRGWIQFFAVFSHEFFSILIIIIGISAIFSSEHSLNTSPLLLSSKYGKSKIITAKIIAGLIFTSSIFILFSAFHITNDWNTNVLKGWSSPIQEVSSLSWLSESSFADSPYALTKIQYLISFLFIKFLGCMAIGVFVMFISSIAKSPAVTFIISFLTVFLPEIFVQFAKTGVIKFIYDFSYYSLFSPAENFKQYHTHNIFGFPIMHLNLLVIVYALISLILIYATYYMGKRQQIY